MASRMGSKWRAKHGEAVRNGLALKKIGNEVMRVIGGREIHPVNVSAGGFYRVPRRKEFVPVEERFKHARDMAVVTCVGSGVPVPGFERDYEFVALRHPSEYPFNEGHVVSNRDIDIDIDDYETSLKSGMLRIRRHCNRWSNAGAVIWSGHWPAMPEFRSIAERRCRLLPVRPGWRRRAAIPLRASSCGALRWSTRARKRCGIIEAYESPDDPSVTVEPRRASGSAAPKRREASLASV